jgi:RNA polymerase subunit RPABC4/transcription elongation factor Spt4
MPATKKCEVCEQEIGESEKVCPKCATDFEAMEDEIRVVTRAQIVAERRRKAALPPEPEVKPEPAKRSVFRSLAPKAGK